jgi:hypothetical protein
VAKAIEPDSAVSRASGSKESGRMKLEENEQKERFCLSFFRPKIKAYSETLIPANPDLIRGSAVEMT